MDWQYILSMAGIFLLQFVFVAFCHLFAYFMDAELYKFNKYNENSKTIKMECSWIFWRCKKENANEIFLVAFVHQIIDVTILFGLITEFIVSIVLKVEIVYNIICVAPVFLYCAYCAYCAIFSGTIEKREK